MNTQRNLKGGTAVNGKPNFKSVILDVMTSIARKYHVHMRHLQPLLKNSLKRKVLAEWLLTGCPLSGLQGTDTPTQGVDAESLGDTMSDKRVVTITQQILGAKFISPLDVQRLWNVEYSDRQKAHLEKTLPSIEEVSVLAECGFILIPTLPEKELSCADIEALYSLAEQGELVCGASECDFWHNSYSELTPGTWAAINVNGLKPARNHEWSVQKELLQEHGLATVSLPDLLYAILTYELLEESPPIEGMMRVRSHTLDQDGSTASITNGDGQPMVFPLAPQFSAQDVGVACRVQLPLALP